MEFDFDVNEFLTENITTVRCDLHPKPEPRCWTPRISSNLENVIDKMGLASAKAQGLQNPITTSSKLRLSNHTLYIMKDANANKGLGSVIGIVKVGKKQLFLSDSVGRQHNMAPLCLLDIYIHESRQRTGCGLQLFEYMLLEEKEEPRLMAIDRPSEKLVNFLRKHYNLVNHLPQGNNFTVFPDIFPSVPLGSQNVPKFGINETTLRSNRSSFPPYSHKHSLSAAEFSVKQRESSVANTVFGSASFENKPQTPELQLSTRSIFCGHQDELNRTWSYSQQCSQIPNAGARFSTCRDSSYNIFGVPSPPNRISSVAQDAISPSARQF